MKDMEELVYSTRNPVLSAREEFYGVDERTLLFSYADTRILEEAKLEALSERVERDVERKLGKKPRLQQSMWVDTYI